MPRSSATSTQRSTTRLAPPTSTPGATTRPAHRRTPSGPASPPRPSRTRPPGWPPTPGGGWRGLSPEGCPGGRVRPPLAGTRSDQTPHQPRPRDGWSRAGSRPAGRTDVCLHRSRTGGRGRGLSDEPCGEPGRAVGGCLTPWHVHDNLCSSDPDRGMITGLFGRDGQCPRGQVRWAAPPMLHTWVIDLPGGPFVNNVDRRSVFRLLHASPRRSSGRLCGRTKYRGPPPDLQPGRRDAEPARPCR